MGQGCKRVTGTLNHRCVGCLLLRDGSLMDMLKAQALLQTWYLERTNLVSVSTGTRRAKYM